MTGHHPIDVGVLDPATWSTTLGDDGTTDAAVVSDDALVAAMTLVEVALVGALSAVHATVHATADRAVDEAADEAGAPAGTAPAQAAPAVFVGGFTPPDPGAIAEAARGGGNPVIPLLDVLRPQLLPGARERFHLGATSQDILDSAMMVVARGAVARIGVMFTGVVEPLAALADTHRTTPVAGRTLGQHAAPTTFGLRLAVLLDGVARSYRRLSTVELPAQLGGSVGTLAVLVDLLGVERTERVRQLVADELGLAHRAGVWHVERSPITDLGTALAGYVGALGRLGLEIAHLTRTEIGELDVVDGGGSSAMPQKRNPVAAVLLVSNARRAPGLATTLLGSQLALDDRPSGDWHAEWQPLRELLRLAIESTALAAAAIAGLRVNADRMLANIALSNGAIHAERAQWALVPFVGRARAAALVRAALEGPDFVPGLLAAVAVEGGIDASAVADRIRAVTTLGAPVGLSESLIDAAIAATEEL